LFDPTITSKKRNAAYIIAMSVLLLALCALSVPSSVGAVNLRASHAALPSSDNNSADNSVAKHANGSAIAANASLTTAWKLSICGTLPKYGNAKPQNFADQMATFFNKVTKKREPKLYKTGDTVTFECLKGFTLDGSMTGNKTFATVCKGTDVPYFAPSGVCIKASKCGAVPMVKDAIVTTTKVKGGFEFACNPGYSLDGEKVVAGGTQKNVLFTIKCIEFSSKYEVFKGKCQSYKFMAAGPAIAMTTNVFEALFTVNCKGRMVDSFGKFTSGNVTTAPTVDCTKITTAGAKVGGKSCAQLVTAITTVFTSKKTAYLAAKDSPNREWFDKSTTDPNVETESMTFCKNMWALTQKKMPAAAQLAGR